MKDKAATQGAEGESVLTKTEDAMDYIEPFLDKFPRPEKGYAGLATKIRQCLNGMAECAMNTQKCHYAKSVLKELNDLDKQLMYCRFYAKRAQKKKVMSLHTYATFGNDYLNEIGKMLGSWIKKVAATAEAEAKRKK